MRSGLLETCRDRLETLEDWSAETALTVFKQLNLDLTADRVSYSASIVNLLTKYTIEHRALISMRLHFNVSGPTMVYFTALSFALEGEFRLFAIEITKTMAQVYPSAIEADCTSLFRRPTSEQDAIDSFTIFFNNGPWFYRKGIYRPLELSDDDLDDKSVSAQSGFILLVARWLSDNCPAVLPTLQHIIQKLEDISSSVIDRIDELIKHQDKVKTSADSFLLSTVIEHPHNRHITGYDDQYRENRHEISSVQDLSNLIRPLLVAIKSPNADPSAVSHHMTTICQASHDSYRQAYTRHDIDAVVYDH